MSLKNLIHSIRDTSWTYAQKTIVQRLKSSMTESKNETITKKQCSASWTLQMYSFCTEYVQFYYLLSSYNHNNYRSLNQTVIDLQQYFRLVLKISVALIHETMSKLNVMNTIELFQEKLNIIVRYSILTFSQYIISIIKLIKVKYTLHRIRWLIQFDSEWMKWDQEQIKKRINWINQQKMTSTYLLQCIEFNVKQVIYDQQNWRTHLMKLTLDSDQFV